jgi:N-acyl homoserine lactone hydrolase
VADNSIWVMEYAYIPEVPTSSVIYGAHNQGVRKLPCGYVLIHL